MAPPFEGGAVHVICNDVPYTCEVSDDGAMGTVDGTTVEATDVGPHPTMLIAATVTEYPVPV